MPPKPPPGPLLPFSVQRGPLPNPPPPWAEPTQPEPPRSDAPAAAAAEPAPPPFSVIGPGIAIVGPSGEFPASGT